MGTVPDRLVVVVVVERVVEVCEQFTGWLAADRVVMVVLAEVSG